MHSCVLSCLCRGLVAWLIQQSYKHGLDYRNASHQCGQAEVDWRVGGILEHDSTTTKDETANCTTTCGPLSRVAMPPVRVLQLGQQIELPRMSSPQKSAVLQSHSTQPFPGCTERQHCDGKGRQGRQEQLASRQTRIIHRLRHGRRHRRTHGPALGGADITTAQDGIAEDGVVEQAVARCQARQNERGDAAASNGPAQIHQLQAAGDSEVGDIAGAVAQEGAGITKPRTETNRDVEKDGGISRTAGRAAIGNPWPSRTSRRGKGRLVRSPCGMPGCTVVVYEPNFKCSSRDQGFSAASFGIPGVCRNSSGCGESDARYVGEAAATSTLFTFLGSDTVGPHTSGASGYRLSCHSSSHRNRIGSRRCTSGVRSLCRQEELGTECSVCKTAPGSSNRGQVSSISLLTSHGQRSPPHLHASLLHGTSSHSQPQYVSMCPSLLMLLTRQCLCPFFCFARLVPAFDSGETCVHVRVAVGLSCVSYVTYPQYTMSMVPMHPLLLHSFDDSRQRRDLDTLGPALHVPALCVMRCKEAMRIQRSPCVSFYLRVVRQPVPCCTLVHHVSFVPSHSRAQCRCAMQECPQSADTSSLWTSLRRSGLAIHAGMAIVCSWICLQPMLVCALVLHCVEHVRLLVCLHGPVLPCTSATSGTSASLPYCLSQLHRDHVDCHATLLSIVTLSTSTTVYTKAFGTSQQRSVPDLSYIGAVERHGLWSFSRLGTYPKNTPHVSLAHGPDRPTAPVFAQPSCLRRPLLALLVLACCPHDASIVGIIVPLMACCLQNGANAGGGACAHERRCQACPASGTTQWTNADDTNAESGAASEWHTSGRRCSNTSDQLAPAFGSRPDVDARVHEIVCSCPNTSARPMAFGFQQHRRSAVCVERDTQCQHVLYPKQPDATFKHTDRPSDSNRWKRELRLCSTFEKCARHRSAKGIGSSCGCQVTRGPSTCTTSSTCDAKTCQTTSSSTGAYTSCRQLHGSAHWRLDVQSCTIGCRTTQCNHGDGSRPLCWSGCTKGQWDTSCPERRITHLAHSPSTPEGQCPVRRRLRVAVRTLWEVQHYVPKSLPLMQCLPASCHDLNSQPPSRWTDCVATTPRAEASIADATSARASRTALCLETSAARCSLRGRTGHGGRGSGGGTSPPRPVPHVSGPQPLKETSAASETQQAAASTTVRWGLLQRCAGTARMACRWSMLPRLHCLMQRKRTRLPLVTKWLAKKRRVAGSVRTSSASILLQPSVPAAPSSVHAPVFMGGSLTSCVCVAYSLVTLGALTPCLSPSLSIQVTILAPKACSVCVLESRVVLVYRSPLRGLTSLRSSLLAAVTCHQQSRSVCLVGRHAWVCPRSQRRGTAAQLIRAVAHCECIADEIMTRRCVPYICACLLVQLPCVHSMHWLCACLMWT